MKATMSCDHRVVDGAVGAKWFVSLWRFLLFSKSNSYPLSLHFFSFRMKAFKQYLESPLSLML